MTYSSLTVFLKTFCVLTLVSTLIYIMWFLRVFMENLKNTTIETRVNNFVPVVNSAKGDVLLVYSYRDFQAQLCKKNLDWPDKTSYKPGNGSCPQKGIVTVVAGGRTGNQMWEYAATWAVARHTGLDPYVPNCIKNHLTEIFENLTLPDFTDIAHCPVEFKTYVTIVEDWSNDSQSIILPRYTTQPSYVLPQFKDVKEEFRFNKQLRDKAQQTLWNIVKDLPSKEYIFIGIHVRRTDYVNYLKRKYNITPVRTQFFFNAMDYYRQKYSNCLFIIASDDPTWCHNQFGKLKDAFVASDKSSTPSEDLAILAACNHSIFDYGTYGEWGTLLAGGEAIYNNTTQNFFKAKFMKRWTMMD